jgi:hypothetical protein
MKRQIIFFAVLGICLSYFPQKVYSQVAEADAFIQGAKTVKEIIDYSKSAASWMHQHWWHDWYVIKYKDGYCIFNRFKHERTIKDVISHSRGNGDCDWWAWPEGSPHVCLDSEAHARALIKKHGKIVDIKGIDHPTGNCGH